MRSWRALTGDSYAQFLKTDISRILRWLEYDNLENELEKMKQANAQPQQ